MKDLKDNCRIALVQAAPVMFSAKRSTEKAVKLINEAAGEHPDLIVFPELFIPGYPYGMTFGFTVGHRDEEGRKDWKMYYDNSILIPGTETKLLGEAAKSAGAYVSIVDPYGHYVNEPVWDREEIIYEDLDMQKVPAAKMEFDPVGHYARNDVLKLEVSDK